MPSRPALALLAEQPYVEPTAPGRPIVMDDLQEQLGATLGATYVVERELRGGGMSRVFVAEERALGRRVVVKVLPPELAGSISSSRFGREIQVAAGLQHPHIVPVLSAGQAGDFLYYTMPLVAGESLRARIERERQLPVDDALRIAREVGDALDYAHRHGVVHRDVKPENILLHEGHAFVTDFGIARAVSAATGERLTGSGLAIGTPAYMSPEQASGDPDVDGRSDLYSLGCVLYEMLAGEPPYTGPTLRAVLAKRFVEPAPGVRRMRGSVPEVVDAAIRRVLAAVPADRFVTATDFVAALEARTPADLPATLHPRSIVVLPFANLSADPDNDYFSDGLTEEVIADLSQVSTLRVISRTSSMKLKAVKEDLRAIGRQLNVRYVLEGSVRKAGTSLRITAQLVDALEDVQLWAEKFSGTLEDVFDIQEKVSRAIVSALRVKLAPEEERRIAARPIADVHAYECYQRARHEIWRVSPGGLERALHLVRNGLAIVGENALLYALMGQVHWQRAHAGAPLGGSHLADAERALEKAFTLDPASAHCHTLSAAIHYKRGRLQDVVWDSKRALASDPNNAEALFWLSVMYAHAGRASAARPLAEHLLQVDPLNATNYWARAWVEFTDGNFAEALRFSSRGCELDPGNLVCRCGHVVHLAAAGQITEACREIDALPHAPELPWSRSFLRYKAALQGNKEEVLQYAAADVLSFAWDDEYASWQMADTFALVGEHDEALRWLEHATLERGFVNYPFLSHRDPFLEGLRGDPRFEALMQRVKREWEAFEL